MLGSDTISWDKSLLAEAILFPKYTGDNYTGSCLLQSLKEGHEHQSLGVELGKLLKS